MAEDSYAVSREKTNAPVDFIHHAHTFGNATSLHGIQYVTGEKIHFIRRLFWLLVVLISLSWGGYSIHGYLRQYKRFDIKTKVGIEYNENQTFPAMTFCNLNQWRKSLSHDAVIDLVKRIYALKQEARDEFNWTEFYEATGWPNGTLNMTEAVLSSNGSYTAEQMIKECVWNGVTDCGHENFTTSITDLGVCYTFNNPSNVEDTLVVNKPGIDKGLTLTLDIKQDDYLPGEFQGAGVKVLLHPHGEHPLMKEAGFAVSPGFETLVGIKHTKGSALLYPTEFFKHKLKSATGPMIHSSRSDDTSLLTVHFGKDKSFHISATTCTAKQPAKDHQ